jgi:tetratricopeptide (TPR) repeat protein
VPARAHLLRFIKPVFTTCRLDGIWTRKFAASGPLRSMLDMRTRSISWACFLSTPNKRDYLLSLGTALEQQGLHEQALKAFDKTVQMKPDDAELWARFAYAHVLVHRPAEAILGLQHALKLNPRYWYAASNCAVLLLQSERFEEALVNFNLCDELQPNQAPTLHGRAVALHNLNRFEEAVADSRRAQALDPTNAEICNNIGAALQKLGRYEEALEWFDRTLGLRPNFVGALNNKASALIEIQRFDEAVLVYRHLKKIDPITPRQIGIWPNFTC